MNNHIFKYYWLYKSPKMGVVTMNKKKHKLLEKILTFLWVPVGIIIVLLTGDPRAISDLLLLGLEKSNEY